ncbi:hypothetical protein Vse01_15260 [Micromonospora sediminimaris]|uniref:Uncharacterized protein n=1 Tax=Micromonospora sediminimaris TaxID=547162 RepID=A0A9W5UQG9_9ACTN|nr:hypothetical protein Vse01_15260 [Micromonospora sediminimaris]
MTAAARAGTAGPAKELIAAITRAAVTANQLRYVSLRRAIAIALPPTAGRSSGTGTVPVRPCPPCPLPH